MLIDNTNHARNAIKQGKKVSAAWLQAGSPITAEVMARAGFDVCVIDMEHGPGDIMCLINQIQAMKGYPAIPFARAPWNDLVTIKRMLDSGVFGLVIPYVNTRAEAEAAVSAALYPTAGFRGIAGSPRAPGYGLDAKEYLTRANDEICIFTQVETPLAVKNLDEILQIKRIDGIFIGPMDLSTSMGYFANPGAEEVQKVILDVEKRVLAAGKALATVAGGWEDAAQKYRRGYSMVVSMSDTANLAQIGRAMVNSFKGEFAK